MLIPALITHFVADFILQRREVGQKKSSSPRHLAEHIAIIFVCFLPFGLQFALYNALIHAVIDASIWNLYKVVVKIMHPGADHTYKYWTDHKFYATIGLDQLLHTLTIVYLSGV